MFQFNSCFMAFLPGTLCDKVSKHHLCGLCRGYIHQLLCVVSKTWVWAAWDCDWSTFMCEMNENCSILHTGPNLFCKDPQHLMCELTMVIAVSLIKHSPAKLYGPIFSHICLKTTHHKIQRSNTALIITNPIWSETGVSSWIWIWSEVPQPLFVPTLLRVFADGQ